MILLNNFPPPLVFLSKVGSFREFFLSNILFLHFFWVDFLKCASTYFKTMVLKLILRPMYLKQVCRCTFQVLTHPMFVILKVFEQVPFVNRQVIFLVRPCSRRLKWYTTLYLVPLKLLNKFIVCKFMNTECFLIILKFTK